jgi:hypothetical protein
MLGNTFIAEKELKPPNKEVPPQVETPLLDNCFCVNVETNFLFILSLQIIYPAHKRFLDGLVVSNMSYTSHFGY